MNKKVYKMYEAPKMEIVEVEVEAMLASSPGIGESGVGSDGGKYDGDYDNGDV